LLLAVLTALLALPGAGAVHGATGVRIDTAAGTGTAGFSGDGGPAKNAEFTSPSYVASGGGGGAYLIADSANNRIRRVDGAGTITTVAGSGPCCGIVNGFVGSVEGAPATSVLIYQPRAVAPTADGGFLIADTGNDTIRKVAPDGTIRTVAGTPGTPTSTPASLGDAGPATGATLKDPRGVVELFDGSFLIADTGNNRIRKVSTLGNITTVAGTGAAGFSGDDGAAALARLNAPEDVAALPDGGFLIADTGNDRIRRVDAINEITTVAGDGGGEFSGDGGPATRAALNGPEGVAARDDGSVVVADSGNQRVREIGADGVIRTLAGTGTAAFSGDGGPAAAARLWHPRAVALDGSRIWIADTFNHRIRVVTATPASPPVDTPPSQPPPGVSPPVLFHRLVANPVHGRVLVRVRGSHRFVPLRAVTNLPLGSELDTTDGVAHVFFTTSRAGRTATAVASQGRFVTGQDRTTYRGQYPGVLRLSGPLHGCRAPRARASSPLAAAARFDNVGRRVRVHARGRIKTKGRYGAAIVRGTIWTTVDRCPSDPRPGTLVSVARGVVAVHAYVLHRVVLVPAHHRFLAPARRGR
jgi:hypothetical protein